MDGGRRYFLDPGLVCWMCRRDEIASRRSNANSIVNVGVGYQLGKARLTVYVMNVLDEAHSDIQCYYFSRLAGEPAGGVGDVHFHSAEPRQLRLSLSWRL